MLLCICVFFGQGRVMTIYRRMHSIRDGIKLEMPVAVTRECVETTFTNWLQRKLGTNCVLSRIYSADNIYIYIYI